MNYTQYQQMEAPSPKMHVLCKIPTASEIATKTSYMHRCIDDIMDEKQCLLERLFTKMHSEYPEKYPTASAWKGDWFEANYVFLRFDVQEGNRVEHASHIVVHKEDNTFKTFSLKSLRRFYYDAHALMIDYSPELCGLGISKWSSQFSKMILIEERGLVYEPIQLLSDLTNNENKNQQYYINHGVIIKCSLFGG